jgi:hypothetical protein
LENIEITKFLLKKGASSETLDEIKQFTPLDYCRILKNEKIEKIFQKFHLKNKKIEKFHLKNRIIFTKSENQEFYDQNIFKKLFLNLDYKSIFKKYDEVFNIIIKGSNSYFGFLYL